MEGNNFFLKNGRVNSGMVVRENDLRKTGRKLISGENFGYWKKGEKQKGKRGKNRGRVKKGDGKNARKSARELYARRYWYFARTNSARLEPKVFIGELP